MAIRAILLEDRLDVFVEVGGCRHFRAGGVPSYRETRHYVQKITDSYFRIDSRGTSIWGSSRPIYRAVDERGKVVYDRRDTS